MCISALLSLFGCKAHILDGPGMVNKAQWTAFSVSRNDSYAQYNFSFTVTDNEEGSFVTGYCRDNEGNLYECEDGIPIPPDKLIALRELGIDDLNDVPQSTAKQEDLEDLIILDDCSLNLSVVYYKNLNIEKCVTAEMTLDIYNILLPLFAENCAK